MPVELINNHVLLPDTADYSAPVKWGRRWHNAIADGVTGAEARAALRAEPRLNLSYQLTPSGIVAAEMLDDRIRAALKSGLACCPMFGRGGGLMADADAGATEVEVGDAFPWQAGDWFFTGDENNYDALLVTAAVLDGDVWTLTLDDPLTADRRTGALAWPLLFGKPTVGNLTAFTTRITPVQITLTELTSARSAQLGAVTPPGGAGIGVMVIETDLEVA